MIDPVIIDSGMRQIKIKWNNNGSVLAISGTQLISTPEGEEKEIAFVQLYDPFGNQLRLLKIPSKSVSSLAWESNGL